jgi:mRNA-degrading endonuclease toxin of MazEF toxin-antitoxin module
MLGQSHRPCGIVQPKSVNSRAKSPAVPITESVREGPPDKAVVDG